MESLVVRFFQRHPVIQIKTGLLITRSFEISLTNFMPVGSNMPGISSSVRVQTMAAMMLPLEAPEMIRGSNRALCKHLMTPKWWSPDTMNSCVSTEIISICLYFYLPKVPPPLSKSAVRPKLCRMVMKKSCFARKSSSGSEEGASQIQFSCRTTWSM